MLASFKSRPSSSNVRTVPYGGLGGCVELVADAPKFEHAVLQDTGQSKTPRRKPAPIHIRASDVPQGARSSPMLRHDHPLQLTPKAPLRSADCLHPSKSEHDLNLHVPYPFWDRCKDNPWLATVPRKESWYTAPARSHKTQVAELPGSLLLPSQGFAQTDPPATPPRPNQPVRTDSDSSDTSSLPSLTHSCESSPDTRGEPPRPPADLLLSPLQSHPHIPSPNNASPVIRKRDITSMNAEELLLALPDLDAREIEESWMPSMEAELGKLREMCSSIKTHRPENRIAFQPFCEKIQRVLRQAEFMCESHNAEFRGAQEATDPNRQSDYDKVKRIRDRLRDTMPGIPSPGWLDKPQHNELETIRIVLLRSIQIIGGFVRNQMTFQLHRSYGGLSDTLVNTLRNFDREKPMQHYRSVSDSVLPSSNNTKPRSQSKPRQDVPNNAVREPITPNEDQDVYGFTPKHQRSKGSKSSEDSDMYGFTPKHQRSKGSKSSGRSNPNGFTPKHERSKGSKSSKGVRLVGTEYNEPAEILQSYFDHNSISSVNDSVIGDPEAYKSRIAQIDNQSEPARRRSFMPPQTRELDTSNTRGAEANDSSSAYTAASISASSYSSASSLSQRPKKSANVSPASSISPATPLSQPRPQNQQQYRKPLPQSRTQPQIQTRTQPQPQPQQRQRTNPPPQQNKTKNPYSLETLDSHFKSQIALRDFQVDDLRRKIEKLESQNRNLQSNLDSLVHQTRVGFSTPSTPAPYKSPYVGSRTPDPNFGSSLRPGGPGFGPIRSNDRPSKRTFQQKLRQSLGRGSPRHNGITPAMVSGPVPALPLVPDMARLSPMFSPGGSTNKLRKPVPGFRV